jgi:cytoplasmic iron level regulating protein YaaA (DUF328/UPF0246 family)
VPKRAQRMKKKSAAQEIRFFWKNRISQTVPKRAQKLKNKSGAQEIRFFWKNRISQTVCPNVPMIIEYVIEKKSILTGYVSG